MSMYSVSCVYYVIMYSTIVPVVGCIESTKAI